MQVPKFYWTVMWTVSRWPRRWSPSTRSSCPDSRVRIPASALPFDLGHRIDAVIDAQDKPAGQGRRHAGPPDGGDGRAERPGLCASNNIAPISPVEHYLLVDGTAGERDDRGVEIDLLSG